MVHTILVDPQDPNRIYVAISAAGTYRSDDGGKSWTAKNKNVRADFMPEKYPVFGQCVHKLALHPAKSNALYQQNHCGVYRSENRGDDWTEITEGLPSQFGFPFAIHSKDPDTIYVVPLTDDGNRVAAALCECIRGRRRRPLASRRRQSDPGWTAGLDRGQYCGRA
jgi:hypothetical protein